jgi:hypothetical protein
MLCHVADGFMFEFALSLAACTTADPFEITYIVYLNVKHFEHKITCDDGFFSIQIFRDCVSCQA